MAAKSDWRAVFIYTITNYVYAKPYLFEYFYRITEAILNFLFCFYQIFISFISTVISYYFCAIFPKLRSKKKSSKETLNHNILYILTKARMLK